MSGASSFSSFVAVAFGLLAVVATAPAHAQRRTDPQQADLLVEGLVARLYASDDDVRLVEVHPRSVALGGGADLQQGLRAPAPGEALYVVVAASPASRRRLGRLADDVPAPGDVIRARLQAAPRGTWSASGDWFEVVSTGGDGARDAASHEVPSSVDELGMACEAKLVGGRLGLAVTQIRDGSPAQQAGFQPGDTIIAIDGRPIAAADELSEAIADRRSVTLTVIDVNTGRTAAVSLSGAPEAAGRRGRSPRANVAEKAEAAEWIARALGLAVESSQSGSAVEVRTVQANSPAADAGIEAGDVIVAVGEQHVADMTSFAEAIPRTPSRVILQVRDVRSGREVPIEIVSQGVARVPDGDGPSVRRARRESQSAGATGTLGIVGEVTFYKAEAAVKVVRIDRGSAADQAGMQPGMILLSADGKPLLHPDDLSQAASAAAGRITIRVANPSTEREFDIEIRTEEPQ